MPSSPASPPSPAVAAEPPHEPAEAALPVRASSTRLRRWALDAGHWKVSIVVTIVTTITSLLVTAVAGQLAGLSDAQAQLGLIIGTIVPLLVAPPIAWTFTALMFEAEAARQIAERLAVTDPLTGVFNRRRFFELAEIEFRRARRLSAPMAVLLIDIDHFKGFNDVYGHAIGDLVLSQVAQSCAGGLRRYDVIARYGGEEFVVLLPSTDIQTAAHVAERLRSDVAALRPLLKPPVGGRDTIEATVSIGAAELQPPVATFSTLLDLADQAMYRAKATGRNRICTMP